MEITILESLIEKCKQNDRASQEVLYRHYFPAMYRIVKRMIQDEHDLVSIINDGFLKVFKYISKYNSELGVFDAWMHTVIVNVAYDHLKKSKKKIKFSEIREDNEVSDNSYLCVISPKEIESLLIKLPATTGKVLAMSIDGYKHKEIAFHLGISEISSRWHLSEARKQLKDVLHYKSKMA